MKKVMYVLILFVMIFTVDNVNADKLYTKISGNKEVRPGENIVCTVIADRNLTEYESILEYDREVLNLVSIDEVKLDTSNRTFNVIRDDVTSIKISGSVATPVIYAINFTAKNNINVLNTDISIKTVKAKVGSESLTFDTVDYRIKFVEEDSLFIEDKEETNSDNILSKFATDIGKIFNEYGNPIMWGSIGLNILLIILLINSIRRKKVDYDF